MIFNLIMKCFRDECALNIASIEIKTNLRMIILNSMNINEKQLQGETGQGEKKQRKKKKEK